MPRQKVWFHEDKEDGYLGFDYCDYQIMLHESNIKKVEVLPEVILIHLRRKAGRIISSQEEPIPGMPTLGEDCIRIEKHRDRECFEALQPLKDAKFRTRQEIREGPALRVLMAGQKAPLAFKFSAVIGTKKNRHKIVINEWGTKTFHYIDCDEESVREFIKEFGREPWAVAEDPSPAGLMLRRVLRDEKVQVWECPRKALEDWKKEHYT